VKGKGKADSIPSLQGDALCKPSLQIDHALKCDPFYLMLGEDFSDDDQQSLIAFSSLLAEDDQSKEESYRRRFKLKSPIEQMGFLSVLPQVFGASCRCSHGHLGETFCVYASVGNHS